MTPAEQKQEMTILGASARSIVLIKLAGNFCVRFYHMEVPGAKKKGKEGLGFYPKTRSCSVRNMKNVNWQRREFSMYYIGKKMFGDTQMTYDLTREETKREMLFASARPNE